MKRGFTLIELLVVILIIGILAAISLPKYAAAVEKAKSAEAVNLIASISQAAERYRMQWNSFPNKLNKLDIELPGLDASGEKVSTKDFEISSESSSDSSFYTVTAKRNTDEYKLFMTINNSGDYIRCCGKTKPSSITQCGDSSLSGDTATMCNSITNGNATNGKW